MLCFLFVYIGGVESFYKSIYRGSRTYFSSNMARHHRGGFFNVTLTKLWTPAEANY